MASLLALYARVITEPPHDDDQPIDADELQPLLTNLEMALEDLDAERPIDRELLEFAKEDAHLISSFPCLILPPHVCCS